MVLKNYISSSNANEHGTSVLKYSSFVDTNMVVLEIDTVSFYLTWKGDFKFLQMESLNMNQRGGSDFTIFSWP